MSSRSTPIPVHRFAEAIKDLPLENLHTKGAELRNSIAHLESSNQQLELFVDGDNQDCADAIKENEDVIKQMGDRIILLRSEVERRGFIWGEQKQEPNLGLTNGYTEKDKGHGPSSQHTPNLISENGIQDSRALSDEELAGLLREQMVEEGNEQEEAGVHL